MKMRRYKSLLKRCLTTVGYALSGAGTCLLSLASPALAQQPLVIERGGREARVAGRIGQPGQERRTHRGWEVYGDQFLVLANTTQEDARLAAQTFRASSDEARRQLEMLVGPLPRGNRAQGATQIIVDRQPAPGGVDTPFIRRSGQAISIHVDVSPGHEALGEQLSSLRDAAAVQIVETYLAGPAVPEPLRVGLASFLARQSDVVMAGEAERGGATNLLATNPGGGAGRTYQQLRADSTPRGKHPWTKSDRPNRAERVRDEGVVEEEVVAARQLVDFLLTGYDGRLAAPFGAALRQSIVEQEESLRPQHQSVRGEAPPATASVLAEFVNSLESQFESWQADATVGLPKWEALDKDDPALAERQRELSFVLRLLNRPAPTAVRPVEPKLIESTGNGTVVKGAGGTLGRPIDLAQWVRTESRKDERWAITDANGVLVWNHDAPSLQQRLALDSGRYSAFWRDGRIVAREPLGEGKTLEAWLEPLPGDAWGAIARFKIHSDN